MNTTRKARASPQGVLVSILFALCLVSVVTNAQTTITVTSRADSGAGTLRQAIDDAVAGDIIDFAVTGTITLTSGQLDILNKGTEDSPLKIFGPGKSLLAIDGNSQSRVLRIEYSVVEISGITASGGYTTGHGGGMNINRSIVTLTDATVSDNVAGGNGGGIANANQSRVILTDVTVLGNTGASGGGILNSITFMTASNVDVSGNTALYQGGGIYNKAVYFTLSNSTLSDNVAGGNGGGIHHEFFHCSGYMLLTNVTVSGNSATLGGGVYHVDRCLGSSRIALTNATISNNTASGGGGIYNDSLYTVFVAETMTNTVLSRNIPVDCSWKAHPVTSLGYNLDSDNTCSLTATGDLPGYDPSLGPLANNGGPTYTHALLEDSPAIDAGNNGACPLTDQREVDRPQDGNRDGTAICDIGAFELVAITPYEEVDFLIQDLIDSGALTEQQGGVLFAKIDSAQASADRGQIDAACNKTNAMLNQTQAYINSGRLTVEEAQRVIDSVNAYEDELGCSA